MGRHTEGEPTVLPSPRRLFTDYPESKQYFRTIPTEGALYTSPLVAFHGRRVMATINQVFENLDNWRQTCKLLECLVDRHKNTHQVPLRMFQVLPGGGGRGGAALPWEEAGPLPEGASPKERGLPPLSL